MLKQKASKLSRSEKLTNFQFIVGELAQICPHRINKRLFLLMQGIIFQQGTSKRKKIPSSQTQSNEPVQCAFTPTTKLQALSVITLAKMCLQNEDMAKRVVPAFGHLLDTTKVSSKSIVASNLNSVQGNFRLLNEFERKAGKVSLYRLFI